MRDTMTPEAFERKLQLVQQDLRELEPIIARTPEGPARDGLLARRASLLRTRRWYVKRLPQLLRRRAAAEQTGTFTIEAVRFADHP